jgi:hypothetical protein
MPQGARPGWSWKLRNEANLGLGAWQRAGPVACRRQQDRGGAGSCGTKPIWGGTRGREQDLGRVAESKTGWSRK